MTDFGNWEHVIRDRMVKAIAGRDGKDPEHPNVIDQYATNAHIGELARAAWAAAKSAIDEGGFIIVERHQ